MSSEPRLHLAVALKDTGWHPAAWRLPGAATHELFTAGYWTRLMTEAEAGTLDFVTVEDGLSLQSAAGDRADDRIDQVRGSLSAVQVAACSAPLTRRVGLVPAVTVTYTEPFHTSCAIATLDFVSTGRAGWHVQVSDRPDEARHFDRRLRPAQAPDEPAARWQEAGDYVDAVRGLWDSWDDDAVIRDPAARRFLDADKLHRVGFRGRWFSVAGPSITPRPPQGQPVVCAPVRDAGSLRFAAASADVVMMAPHDSEHLRELVRDVRAARRDAGREGEAPHIFADLTVVLETEQGAAADRLARLDTLGGTLPGDAAVFVGTPVGLAERLISWQAAGVTGFRLRPAVLPYDLHQITRALVPLLRSRGSFRDRYDANTLRGLLGLPRPANRHSSCDGNQS